MKRILLLAALLPLAGCAPTPVQGNDASSSQQTSVTVSENVTTSTPAPSTETPVADSSSTPGASATPEASATPTPAPKPLGPPVTTKSGLKYQVFRKGKGEVAKASDHVFVHYTGTLQDGTKFDSSLDRNAPIDFVLGTGAVIKGWDEGIAGMKVGEKRKLTIPPDLAYGDAGFPGAIPPKATLTFDVELIKVDK